MIAWNVILNDEEIDTVFYDNTCDAEYVYKGLVDHDGYNPAIRVKREDLLDSTEFEDEDEDEYEQYWTNPFTRGTEHDQTRHADHPGLQIEKPFATAPQLLSTVLR